MNFTEIFEFLKPLILPAFISLIVSSIVPHYLKKIENRDKTKLEYEHEQRKKNHELIGRYKGKLVNSANSLLQRQLNIYKNHQKGWLSRSSKTNSDGYYFCSTAYRFLCFFSIVRQLDIEAVLLDPQIAKEDDFIFLKYIALINWVMTDVSLFDGINYDDSIQKDHFYSDEFRQLAEKCISEGKLISFENFKSGPFSNGDIEQVLKFFDGLSKSEERLRWDRLVALHLLLMAFLNKFGYDWQKSNSSNFKTIVDHINNKIVLNNLIKWIDKYHLSCEEVKNIKNHIKN